ncbi:8-oxo-dGDP phosphatase NUDT18 isoform X3 [Synchiropus splendidus]|uniref:8-oxo-dGDP phosphatase NUDT18 isoform X3 n=1 Tax=Synchiropus splendidus TaxID=270530 RepID=UPI00237D40CB|nr:8-oxo-dGDP phosphatase NUDT18 isoform X3 [Synchiropus splendidus]
MKQFTDSRLENVASNCSLDDGWIPGQLSLNLMFKTEHFWTGLKLGHRQRFRPARKPQVSKGSGTEPTTSAVSVAAMCEAPLGTGQVEDQVEHLLEGRGSEVSTCDVGLDQSKPATLRKTVTYIVSAVIFNEQNQVLMVQEAKPDCYKQWYLPAGRVEVGENFEEALKREVKEEAGFDCEPITLLLIQEQGPQWIRFVFLARVTGGSIKPLSAADQESLQATWWDQQTALPLRGRDILQLIDCGLKYRQDPWHPVTRPVDLSCRHVVQRLVLVYTSAAGDLWILLVRAPVLHIPTAAASAAQRAAAWTDRRHLLQHSGAAGTGPRPTQRGRRETGAGVHQRTSPCGEPSVPVAQGPEAVSEREAAGEAEDNVPVTAAQPLLTTTSETPIYFPKTRTPVTDALYSFLSASCDSSLP